MYTVAQYNASFRHKKRITHCVEKEQCLSSFSFRHTATRSFIYFPQTRSTYNY